MTINRTAALSLAAALALTTAGCATPFGERLQRTFSAIGAATSFVSAASAAEVEPKTIMVAAGVFDGVQVTATNYLRLKPCSKTSGPVCRQPAATVPIIRAMSAGRKARKAAVGFVKTHPGQLGPSGLYDALQTAIATGQQIFADYQVDATVTAAAAAKPGR